MMWLRFLIFGKETFTVMKSQILGPPHKKIREEGLVRLHGMLMGTPADFGGGSSNP